MRLKANVRITLHYGKGPLYLREISKREEISEKYLSQLAILLKSAGLILSVRGVGGGYVLAKESSQVKLFEVVNALEGDLSLVPCIKDSFHAIEFLHVLQEKYGRN